PSPEPVEPTMLDITQAFIQGMEQSLGSRDMADLYQDPLVQQEYAALLTRIKSQAESLKSDASLTSLPDAASS
ncbi:hypothetical protein HDU91_007534, partial [Kappamyces sp. JEL0680]